MVQQIGKSTPDLSGGSQIEMSYDEYVKWFGEGHIGEWVEGRVVEFMPPDERHQDVVLFLAQVLNLFVLTRNLGKVMISPFEMRIRDGRSSREPDVLFVSTKHLGRIDGTRLDGPADLVIEVVSDESVTRDQREKMIDYAMARVPEYWIIDPRPTRELVKGYRLAPESYYINIEHGSAGTPVSQVVPGFPIDVKWFQSESSLDPMAAMSELGASADRW